jgi:hypothetical protein
MGLVRRLDREGLVRSSRFTRTVSGLAEGARKTSAVSHPCWACSMVPPFSMYAVMPDVIADFSGHVDCEERGSKE